MLAPLPLPLFLLLLLLGSTSAFSTSPPKHVVMLVIDDFGFADASYKAELYNGTAPPPTPHIDALAKSGVRLESYYVNKLCSPTRTALLSGRYAYTNGMDDGVIIDGQNIDMPLNLKTIADHLKTGGWNTSAYGKWDAGMTAWGSTPTCRGFDTFHGFYSAASDYFTHMVGGQGFDYHADFKPHLSASGRYTTEIVTSAVQAWITQLVHDHDRDAITSPSSSPSSSPLKSFAYVAHEAVHGPLEVPERFIEGPCAELVPADHPARLIYCGMVRAVDESVRNITDTYKALGIYDDTLFIVSADNGGQPSDGGNNFPLRGNKATLFEGGVRGLGFVAGAGLDPSVRGTVSHGLMHVTDWLPTLVGGVAGLDIGPGVTRGRPCPTCTRAVAPLDGFDQWQMLSQGQTSARTDVLLDLQATACNAKGGSRTPCNIPGSGAIRSGKWKLIHGHAGVYGCPAAGCDGATGASIKGQGAICVARMGTAVGKSFPLPIPANLSMPWCPYGWTPPAQRGANGYQLPQPPPDACPDGLPCSLGADSTYLSGRTMLFDVVEDMTEHHDVAAANPDIVAALLAKLNAYNASHCGGARCLPVKSVGPPGKPTKISPAPSPLPPPSSKITHVWLPWRGDPVPGHCDTNVTLPPNPADTVKSNLDLPLKVVVVGVGAAEVDDTGGAGGGSAAEEDKKTEREAKKTKRKAEPKAKAGVVSGAGWCWDSAFAGGGVPPMTVRLSVDGKPVHMGPAGSSGGDGGIVANISRAGLPSKTGAPNTEHGFKFALGGAPAATLLGTGLHRLDVDVYLAPHPTPGVTATAPVKQSPVCYRNGKAVECPSEEGW